MNILETIEADLVSAMKEKNESKVSVLRMVKTALKNKEIEMQRPLEDSDALDILSKEAKKRKESAQAFKDGGRTEMAEQELNEYETINQYLPKQLSEEEIATIVKSTISEINASSADMGKVIGVVMQKVKNQVDGGMVSKLVKEELSK